MEQVYFETIKNKQIFCHFSDAEEERESTPSTPSSPRRLLIMSHGFRGSSIGPAREFVDFQRILNRAGFSVLRFDQPHCGNSTGDYLDVSFAEWVETIVYFAQKYLIQGYEVSLLGQSMGATATVVASHRPELRGKIPCLLLWVPDAKTTIKINPDEIYEEAGQKYRGQFWQEAAAADFPACLKDYSGKIHLVYGETDKYVEPELKAQTLQIVQEKGQPTLVLPGQDHSPWDFGLVQEVYRQQLAKLLE